MTLRNQNMNYVKADGERVEEQLQLHHLHQLMHFFQNHRPPSAPPADPSAFLPALAPPHRAPRRKAGLLTPAELKNALARVLDTHAYDAQLDSLFAKLDTSSDGYVDWSEFCTYLLLQFKESDYLRNMHATPFQSSARIRLVTPARQETTSKILAVENPTKFISISKEGSMCVWSTSLHLEKCYSVGDGELSLAQGGGGGSGEERGLAKRRVREWVTDAVYMPNCHRIAVASSGRDIRFYDTTTANLFYEEYHLFGLLDVPTCLNYWYNSRTPSSPSLLCFGDDNGTIGLLHFQRPLSRLFAMPYRKEEGVQKVYFPQLSSAATREWVTYVRLDYTHPSEIRRIVYLPDSNYIAVSSASARASLVIVDVQSKKKTYTFSILKGVDCFDYSRILNALVTGSADHIVRLWNPYVTSRPVALLQGHAMGVVDVKIHESAAHIFSMSRDAVLRVWDIKEQMCIQTVVLKFPANFLDRLPEYGAFPMHLQANPKALLIAANDHIALLKLGRVNKLSSQLCTHAAQLCGAIYNPHFSQVVTAAEDSTVGLWDIETGAKNMMLSNVHSGEEITCLAMDANGRRLFTGARNGSIKIWNVQNGHSLQQLEAVDECEVTGIVSIPERKSILSVGWSRRIVQYSDTEPDAAVLTADLSWKAGQLHREDILTLSFCSPNLLATGSFDGEICVWFVETQVLYKTLRSPPVYTEQYSPVDKLLFLAARVKARRSHSAILVSSEAGALQWWNLFGGGKQLFGSFYAVRRRDESVLALASDSSNSVLVSGDTTGQIVIWDIADYCSTVQGQTMRERPRVQCEWTGHGSAVVSVEWLVHGASSFILSASTDRTARLWTHDGQPIGVFGQAQRWNLRGWGVTASAEGAAGAESRPVRWDDEPERDRKRKKGTERDKQSSREGSSQEGEEGTANVDAIRNVESQASRGEGGKGLLATADQSQDKHSLCRQSSVQSTGTLITIEGNEMVEERCKETMMQGEASKKTGKQADESVIHETEPPLHKPLLGSRLRDEMQRVQRDRQARRSHVGAFNLSVACARGEGGLQCCPYQAIALPTLAPVDFPENVPLMSSRINPNITGHDVIVIQAANKLIEKEASNQTSSINDWMGKRTSTTRLPSIASSRGEI